MSSNLQITYVRDDTVRVQAVIKDFDGNLLDPATNQVLVYDPAGTNMGSADVSRVGSGTYNADYSIPLAGTAGVWKISWKAQSGSYPARETINFLVAEGP